MEISPEVIFGYALRNPERALEFMSQELNNLISFIFKNWCILMMSALEVFPWEWQGGDRKTQGIAGGLLEEWVRLVSVKSLHLPWLREWAEVISLTETGKRGQSTSVWSCWAWVSPAVWESDVALCIWMISEKLRAISAQLAVTLLGGQVHKVPFRKVSPKPFWSSFCCPAIQRHAKLRLALLQSVQHLSPGSYALLHTGQWRAHSL